MTNKVKHINIKIHNTPFDDNINIKNLIEII